MATPTMQDHLHHGADSSFETYIDSDLILDSSSPAPATPAKDAVKQSQSAQTRVPPLSTLPSRLNIDIDQHGHPSPSPGISAGEFLRYNEAQGSPITTPTTSNSSSLHNLNFEFLDGADSHAGPGSTSTDTLSPHDDMSIASLEHAFMSAGSNIGDGLDSISSDVTSATASSFPSASLDAMADAVFSFGSMASAPTYLARSPLQFTGQQTLFGRAVDDMGHQPGHQNVSHHNSHHHRSLSLRDVAASQAMLGGSNATTTLPFPQVKLEQGLANTAMQYLDHVPTPSKEHQASPSSSALSNTMNSGSPRQEKKRRLTNSKVPSRRASGAKSNSGNSNSGGKKGKGGNQDPVTAADKNTVDGNAAGSKRRRNSSTPAKKGELLLSKTEASATSLNQGMPAPATVGADTGNGEANSSTALQMTTSVSSGPSSVPAVATPSPHFSTLFTMEGSRQGSSAQSSPDESVADDDDSCKKPNNKRPPPSASQITESGMPFPVIDTSAKHSSLFVPPDTSGLTKREARLVKNRAAAFLSRQRKREQFEELEIKCKSLCQLVWKMWLVGIAGDDPAASQQRFRSLVAQDEEADVCEIFETVLALQGGSVAPTEDGQLQGAVAAGIESANGKIIPSTDRPTIALMNAPSSAAQAAHDASRELAKLRAELEESRKREVLLQAELRQG